MNDLVGLIALIIGSVLSFAAFFAMLDVFFFSWVERTQTMIVSRPRRSFLIGLINLLFFGTLALAFFSLRDQTANDLWSALGLFLLALILIALSFGLAAVVRITCERLLPSQEGVRQRLLGTAIVAFASLLPGVGWFLLFPFLALTGIGGFVLVLLQARRKREA
ncbi:MAG: hypothetical protein U0175_28260 [Caldilineaceae bacterium]